MLVLARKRRERVVLIDTETGARITVTVSEVRQHAVRLGFEAPSRFKILREEQEQRVEHATSSAAPA